jgi:hypothetical protein
MPRKIEKVSTRPSNIVRRTCAVIAGAFNGSKATTLSAVPTSRINTLINYLSSKSLPLLCFATIVGERSKSTNTLDEYASKSTNTIVAKPNSRVRTAARAAADSAPYDAMRICCAA